MSVLVGVIPIEIQTVSDGICDSAARVAFTGLQRLKQSALLFALRSRIELFKAG